MKRAAVIAFILASLAFVVWLANPPEPRIRMAPGESHVRAVNRVAAALPDEQAAEFRTAANRLAVHAARHAKGDKLQAVAVQLDGKSVREIIAAYRALPKADRDAANEILHFDRQ